MLMRPAAAAKAVKTATLQTEIIDGFQMLRSEGCNQTMSHLVAWTKALKRKYDPLMVKECIGVLVRPCRNLCSVSTSC